jgi:hypothetical protein
MAPILTAAGTRLKTCKKSKSKKNTKILLPWKPYFKSDLASIGIHIGKCWASTNEAKIAESKKIVLISGFIQNLRLQSVIIQFRWIVLQIRSR